jgi:hypothetical protein
MGPGSYAYDVMAAAQQRQAYVQAAQLRDQARAQKRTQQVAAAQKRRAQIAERRARNRERLAVQLQEIR